MDHTYHCCHANSDTLKVNSEIAGINFAVTELGDRSEVTLSRADALNLLKHLAQHLNVELVKPRYTDEQLRLSRYIVAVAPPGVPARKISMIKLLREITGLGLKEAKELIELTLRD